MVPVNPMVPVPCMLIVVVSLRSNHRAMPRMAPPEHGAVVHAAMSMLELPPTDIPPPLAPLAHAAGLFAVPQVKKMVTPWPTTLTPEPLPPRVPVTTYRPEVSVQLPPMLL